MTTLTAMNTSTLIKLAKEGNQKDLNRRLSVDHLSDNLDPDGIHIVASSMVESDGAIIRAQVLMKMQGQEEPAEGWLDMTIERFNKLAQITVPDSEESEPSYDVYSTSQDADG
jgi:hypothetical protein